MSDRFRIFYPFLGILLIAEVVLLAVYLGSESEASHSLQAGTDAVGERVLEISNELRIQRSGVVHVIEHIKVRSEGMQIKQGIYRAYPLRNTDQQGDSLSYSYKFLKADLDDKPLSIRSKEQGNFQVLTLGRKDFQPGEHTFRVEYELGGAIFRGEKFDELRFAQSGVWSFPVMQSYSIVHLPPFMLAESVIAKGYTGGFEDQKQNFSVKKLSEENRLVYQITKPLRSGEYFAIRIRMPKGFIQESLA